VAAVASVQSKAERRSPHGHVETARDEAISLSVAEPRPHRDRTIRAQGDATEGFSPPACQIQLTMHPRFDKTLFGDLTFGGTPCEICNFDRNAAVLPVTSQPSPATGGSDDWRERQ